MNNEQKGSQLESRPTCPRPGGHRRALLPLGAIAGMAIMLSGSSALAQLKLEAAPEYFYWQEEISGVKLLHENGLRYGLELSYKDPREHGWLSAFRVKLYYGSVDYNGGVQNFSTGTIIPLKTTTEYYGGLFEGRYGYRWGLGEKHFIDAIGGIGMDFWLRKIGSQFGYNEYWFPFYLKAGAEVSPREKGLIGTVGIKVPFYNTQVIDYGRLGDGRVTLHPGVNVSGYAEAGYKFTKSLSLIAFFDSYWFGKSDTQLGVFQPESKSYQVGAKVGWTF